MRREIQERKCDTCGKTVQCAEQMIGGSPFAGWLCLIRSSGSTGIPKPDNGPWEFCCKECAQDFLEGLK